jgi:hypothetical protein
LPSAIAFQSDSTTSCSAAANYPNPNQHIKKKKKKKKKRGINSNHDPDRAASGSHLYIALQQSDEDWIMQVSECASNDQIICRALICGKVVHIGFHEAAAGRGLEASASIQHQPTILKHVIDPRSCLQSTEPWQLD